MLPPGFNVTSAETDEAAPPQFPDKLRYGIFGLLGRHTMVIRKNLNYLANRSAAI
jgi:hypothetical protein